MVVAKAWEVSGTGSFIGEPLAADMLRAVAYKHIGWTGWTRMSEGERGSVSTLNGGMVRRLGKRKIVNHDELYKAIQEKFGNKVFLDIN